jgi:hypothetical protein
MRFEAVSDRQNLSSYIGWPKSTDYTCIMVCHAGYILAWGINTVFPDDLQLVVFGQSPTLCDMDSNDMEAPIVCSTGEAVNAFKDAYALHSCMVLAVCVARFACHVAFKASSVPDLHCFIIRRGHKEHMIRRDSYPSHGLRMGGKMGYQRGLRVSCCAIATSKSVANRISTSDGTFMNLGAKVMLKFSIVVQVQLFE